MASTRESLAAMTKGYPAQSHFTALHCGAPKFPGTGDEQPGSVTEFDIPTVDSDEQRDMGKLRLATSAAGQPPRPGALAQAARNLATIQRVRASRQRFAHQVVRKSGSAT